VAEAASRISQPREPIAEPRDGLGVFAIAELSSSQRSGMLRLLQSCYANVTRDQFEKDLSEKEWAIVGTDESGDVWCFTTLKRIRHEVDGKRIMAFYSGDTASRPDTRGTATSAGIWLLIRKMFSEVAADPDADYYWFMISSTYKSFRLLSRMFVDYAPSPDRELTLREKQILSGLARIKKFEYDAERSIVRFENASIPKEEEPTDTARQKPDPIAVFFDAANPGAGNGERLASLTALRLDNLTPVGRRFVLDSEPGYE
jgi:hypothetical protein